MDTDYAPFPLTKLPAVPRGKALKLFDSGDLFDLSLCSKKMTEIVRDTRVIADLHCMSLREYQSMIQVRFVHQERILWWNFGFCFEKNELQEKRTVGRLHFQNCQKVSQRGVGLDEFRCFFENAEEGMAEVSKHLFYIFPAPIQIEFNVSLSKNLGMLFSYKHLQQFDSLRVIGSIMCQELLEKVFDNIKIHSKLAVEPETDDDYVLSQALEVEDVFLTSARWMTREHLLQMKCRLAYFYDHWFNLNDLKVLAENWLRNKDSQLERLRFGWTKEFETHDLEGLKSHKWNQEQREKNYIYYKENILHRVDCTNGLDIERDDGELATFVYEKNTSSLYFIVWNEKFPERKRLEQLPKKLDRFYVQLNRLNKKHLDSCSLERLLSNPDLKYNEFVDTYKILRGRDMEVREPSVGRSARRRIFDEMFRIIDYQIDI